MSVVYNLIPNRTAVPNVLRHVTFNQLNWDFLEATPSETLSPLGGLPCLNIAFPAGNILCLPSAFKNLSFLAEDLSYSK